MRDPQLHCGKEKEQCLMVVPWTNACMVAGYSTGKFHTKAVHDYWSAPHHRKVIGAKLPDRKIDGMDIWPLFTDDQAKSPQDAYYLYYGNQLQAVRQGKWNFISARISNHGRKTGGTGRFNQLFPGKDRLSPVQFKSWPSRQKFRDQMEITSWANSKCLWPEDENIKVKSTISLFFEEYWNYPSFI